MGRPLEASCRQLVSYAPSSVEGLWTIHTLHGSSGDGAGQSGENLITTYETQAECLRTTRAGYAAANKDISRHVRSFRSMIL